MTQIQENKSGLPEGWRKVNLGDISTIKGGKRLPKGENLISTKTDHYYVRITDLENNSIQKKKLQFITNETFSKISRYIVNSEDIIISIVGTIGLIAKIDNELNNANLTENCVKLIDLKDLDNNFLYYYLISYLGQNEIQKNTVGAVQKKLPIYGIQNIKINLPPLPTQKSISKILSSFDDKIELLREQNETLEKIGQEIFKEWFGKYKIGDKLPEGWRVGKLSEVCEIKNGFAFKSKDYVENGIPVVRTTNFENGTIDMSAPVFLTEEKSKEYNNYFLEKFDFLLVMVGASIGKNVITPSYILPALQNQNMWNFRSKYINFKFYNIYLAKNLVKEQLNSASGSARDFFRKDYFYSLDVIIPNDEKLIIFSYKTKPLFEKIDINLEQIQTLTRVRDEFLPRLMKGKILVEDLEI